MLEEETVDTELESKMDTELSFEAALQELEAVVNQIEDKQTSLDTAIDLFKRGTQLSKICETKLTDAKLRIKQLVGNEEQELVVKTED